MEWQKKTHKLNFQISYDDKTYKEITLKEPDLEALEQIDDLNLEDGKNLSIRQLKSIICALSGLPEAVIGKIHKSDVEPLAEFILPLLVGQDKIEAPAS